MKSTDITFADLKKCLASQENKLIEISCDDHNILRVMLHGERFISIEINYIPDAICIIEFSQNNICIVRTDLNPYRPGKLLGAFPSDTSTLRNPPSDMGYPIPIYPGITMKMVFERIASVIAEVITDNGIVVDPMKELYTNLRKLANDIRDRNMTLETVYKIQSRDFYEL